MIIMLVDDNRQMRDFLKSFFSSTENKIIECANGLEACEKYSLYNPDFVFMDIRMPVMDGIEATCRIRHQFPDSKIIIVTEYDDEHLRIEAAKAGAQKYLLKDNLSDLNQIIH